MLEPSPTTINIAKVKADIRRAARLRESQGSPALNAAAKVIALTRKGDVAELILGGLSGADEFTGMAAAQIPKAEFIECDRFHISDLVKYDDRQFVWNAYLALLKREPDEVGFKAFLEKLSDGELSKIDVLAIIRYSPEGKRQQVRVDGLRVTALARKLTRVTRGILNRATSNQLQTR